jgi:hypothetical protein
MKTNLEMSIWTNPWRRLRRTRRRIGRCRRIQSGACRNAPSTREIRNPPHRGITALGVCALQRPCGSVSRSVIWRAMIVGHAAHSTTAITRGYPRCCVAFAN